MGWGGCCIKLHQTKVRSEEPAKMLLNAVISPTNPGASREPGSDFCGLGATRVPLPAGSSPCPRDSPGLTLFPLLPQLEPSPAGRACAEVLPLWKGGNY